MFVLFGCFFFFFAHVCFQENGFVVHAHERVSLSLTVFLTVFLSVSLNLVFLSFGRGMKGTGRGHVKSNTALL